MAYHQFRRYPHTEPSHVVLMDPSIIISQCPLVVSFSAFSPPVPLLANATAQESGPASAKDAINVMDFEPLARKALPRRIGATWPPEWMMT